ARPERGPLPATWHAPAGRRTALGHTDLRRLAAAGGDAEQRLHAEPPHRRRVEHLHAHAVARELPRRRRERRRRAQVARLVLEVAREHGRLRGALAELKAARARLAVAAEQHDLAVLPLALLRLLLLRRLVAVGAEDQALGERSPRGLGADLAQRLRGDHQREARDAGVLGHRLRERRGAPQLLGVELLRLAEPDAEQA